ncbi:MAG: polysaccharide biosynthesis/export family protein [Dysgonamonadaceae bacterium]|nr:polysaccharide biosynthesis/export family protein [Dysgonamonadaceae bacterium]
MKRIIISMIVVLQMLFLTSCLTTRDTNLLQKPGLGIPSYPKVNPPIEDYRVKFGDQLNIILTINPLDQSTSRLFSFFSSTYGADDMRNFPIRTDGTIYFPYLGDIYVKGKTTFEIQQLLEKRFVEGFATDCMVRVFLANRYYSMIGETGSGRFPIEKEQMTIFQALGQGGSIMPYGDRKNVKIIRQMDGGTMIKSFDLRSRDIVNSEFYYIQPNDIIYIQPLGKQFLGLNSFWSVFGFASSLISFGFMIYGFATYKW